MDKLVGECAVCGSKNVTLVGLVLRLVDTGSSSDYMKVRPRFHPACSWCYYTANVPSVVTGCEFDEDEPTQRYTPQQLIAAKRG